MSQGSSRPGTAPIDLPLGNDRRYLGIARNLAQRIEAGEFKPGYRLPPERELAATLEVSRTTIREALLALELMRHVDIRVGSGVFVVSPPARVAGVLPGEPPDEGGPFEIVEIRRTIEGDAAYKATLRMDDGALDMLDAAQARMGAALDNVPEFDRADAQFHAIIAEGAGNALIARYVRELWGMRRGTMWQRWYDQTRSRANRVRSLQEHARIAKAIRRRLPDAAATAMQAHIDVLADRFFELDIEPATESGTSPQPRKRPRTP